LDKFTKPDIAERLQPPQRLGKIAACRGWRAGERRMIVLLIAADRLRRR
jgi:hypothetical protein